MQNDVLAVHNEWRSACAIDGEYHNAVPAGEQDLFEIHPNWASVTPLPTSCLARPHLITSFPHRHCNRGEQSAYHGHAFTLKTYEEAVTDS